jgi:hypothetical protein
MNAIQRGKRSTIRNPPGKDLAHERGREAAKGYDYSHSNLQTETCIACSTRMMTLVARTPNDIGHTEH